MAIKNSVSSDFEPRPSIVLTFAIAAYPVCRLHALFLEKKFIQ